MVFGDLWFLQFLGVALLAVWVTPVRFRKLALLVACLTFHRHYAGEAGMLPILVLASLVYACLRQSRTAIGGAIFVSIAALVFYKYTAMVNQLTGWTLPVVAPPLAISFFIFEFIHLLSDRVRMKVPPEVRPLDYALFIIFFPSIAAGPIKRYPQFVAELPMLGLPAWPFLTQSLFRVLLGYYKKFGIGDGLAQEIPADLFSWNGSIAGLALLLGARIFVDFSGYSDIAIGLAGLLNIRLPENFSFPYLATNISDFWRRWHISLSTWIRDYVYIALGGSRVSSTRKLLNLLLAMFLCGLWHGAAPHFAYWGLMQGMALLIFHLWKRQDKVTLPPLLSWSLTFCFVQLSWLLFFYDVNQILFLFQNRRPF